MKKPLKPKPMDVLVKKYMDRVGAIVAAGGFEVAPGGIYRHWDKLRHLAPPDGLTNEEWWVGVKFARAPLQKNLPLKDAAGKHFSYCMPDMVIEMLHKIDHKAGGRIELPEEVTNPDTRDRYIFKSLIEEAITSSQLEGASTTRKVAADMLRTKRRPRDKSEQMIFNNFDAINYIRGRKEEKLSPQFVLELHEMLTRDTLDDPRAAGRLQAPGDERVYVADNKTQEILHQPPPAQQLEQRLQDMCDFANDDGGGFIHPIVRAVVLHFWLAYDHPFEDGNGRTARALFYWKMLADGYWLFEYVSISRILKKASAQYGRSYLYTESDENDMTYFIIYQLQVMVRAIEDLEKYLQKKIGELRGVEARLKHYGDFNHRQMALLGHALRHSAAEYTVKSHQTSHGVAYGTAYSDLAELVEKELLIQSRKGRKELIFYPANDINEVIEGIGSA